MCLVCQIIIVLWAKRENEKILNFRVINSVAVENYYI